MDGVTVIELDLRNPENDAKRYDAWLFDQDEHDRLEAERKAAEAASAAKKAKVAEAARQQLKRQIDSRVTTAKQPAENSVESKAVLGIIKAINAGSPQANLLLKTALNNAAKLELLKTAWRNDDIKPQAKEWLAQQFPDHFALLNQEKQGLVL
jgi:hypothetical protein